MSIFSAVFFADSRHGVDLAVAANQDELAL